MYINMHDVRIHACTHACMHAHTHTHIHTQTHANTHTHTHTHPSANKNMLHTWGRMPSLRTTFLISPIAIKNNSSNTSALPVSPVPAVSLYHTSLSLQQPVSRTQWLACWAHMLQAKRMNLTHPTPPPPPTHTHTFFFYISTLQPVQSRVPFTGKW